MQLKVICINELNSVMNLLKCAFLNYDLLFILFFKKFSNENLITIFNRYTVLIIPRKLINNPITTFSCPKPPWHLTAPQTIKPEGQNCQVFIYLRL